VPVIEFIVSSQAEADLIEAFDCYEGKVAGLGSEFVRSVDAEFARIQRRPLAFRLRFGSHRMAMTERFPYAIYFIYDKSAKFVSVRRILHFAQDATSGLR
jgi:plasmid stabilization system protein ParE